MFLRSLEWTLAGLVAVGMVTLGYTLLTEPMDLRERLLMCAALPVMGIFVWGCAAPPLAGRARLTVAAVFGASLLVLFATMIGESRSAASWAGLVMFANIGGLVLFRRRQAVFTGR